MDSFDIAMLLVMMPSLFFSPRGIIVHGSYRIENRYGIPLKSVFSIVPIYPRPRYASSGDFGKTWA